MVDVGLYIIIYIIYIYRYLEPMNYGLFGPRPQGDEHLRWFTSPGAPGIR